jgi:uncharacterized membrane protein YeaQ/YmgE (transglycosylase-associated protein family)
MRTWADRLAFLFSALASPFVVLPTFTLAVVWKVASTGAEFLLWSGIALVCLTLLPAGYIFFQVRAGRITDMHVREREQRRGPFLVGLAGAVLGTALFYLLHTPRELLALSLCTLVNGFVFAFITLRWKISMHPSVLTAAVLVATIFLSPVCAWLFLLLPPVIWARIHRQRHDLWQGMIALLLASGLTVGLFRLFRFL